MLTNEEIAVRIIHMIDEVMNYHECVDKSTLLIGNETLDNEKYLNDHIKLQKDRLLLLKDWMRLTDWMIFESEYPEAEKWFDAGQ